MSITTTTGVQLWSLRVNASQEGSCKSARQAANNHCFVFTASASHCVT